MADAPMTLARIEKMIDDLAGIMVMLGPVGHKALPIYEWLEREAATMRAADAAMAKVRERARQAQARSAAQL